MSVKTRDTRKFDELMAPTIEALKALGGSASNEDLQDWIADHFALPAEARDRLHGDPTMRANDRVTRSGRHSTTDRRDLQADRN